MIVKSSELTRTRREEGRRNGKEGGRRSSVGWFLAMKSRYQGPKGRKVQNQARKLGKKTNQTTTTKKTKAERLMERPPGAGHGRAVSSALRVARTRLWSFCH